MRRIVFALAVGLLLSVLSVRPVRAAGPAPVSPAELDAHIRFLADDLLEGRAPGTRGDGLA